MVCCAITPAIAARAIVLKVEGLSCRYGKVAAVRDLSITVNAGELVALIGGNGAGKTTTLKAISGLIAPVAGRISFLGEDITRATPRFGPRADRARPSGATSRSSQASSGRH